tara:strand:- start:298842 stop:300578 length:1737 start_codon:yes stop_codon:yes gene_type:complete
MDADPYRVLESPRCGSLRPISLEFEGLEVDHHHVVEHKKDTTNSDLINAVDSLLEDIEETTQSFDPKQEKEMDSNALIGDIGELPTAPHPKESASDDLVSELDTEPSEVVDSITEAQQALDEVESQAGDLVSQSLDSMLDELDEPVTEATQDPVPNGEAELESLDAEISTSELLESIDPSIESIDEHTLGEDPVAERAASEPTADSDEVVKAQNDIDELEEAVDALLELDDEQANDPIEAEGINPELDEIAPEVDTADAPDASEPEDAETESLIVESTVESTPLEDMMTEDSLIQTNEDNSVSSADALDDSMDLLDSALAEAADDMLDGDFETEEGELVNGDAVNTEIEQALQEKPVLEPDPAILEDVASDLLDPIHNTTPESPTEAVSEPDAKSDSEASPEPAVETTDASAPKEPAQQSDQSAESKPTIAAIDPDVQSEIEALEELKANEPIPVPAWFERTIEIIRPKIDRFDPLKGKTMDAVAMALGAAIVAVITHAAPLGASGMILVSKPLANRSPEVRNAVGYIAMWTGFLAIVLWVYLLMFRSPSIPTPETAPTRVISADEPIVVRPAMEVLP